MKTIRKKEVIILIFGKQIYPKQ